MHRIDTTTAQKDKWGSGKNGWTNGDPTTSVPATSFNANFCDSIQEELCNAIEKAGLTLDPNDNTQLWQVLSTGFGKYLAIKNNLSEIAAAGKDAQSASRVNLALGTAATLDATTSTTDTTAGRALRVGDFGIGAQTYGVMVDDMNVYERSAYGVSFSRLNQSDDAPNQVDYFNLIMLPETLNGTFSTLAIPENQNAMYRGYGVGSNKEMIWVKLYDELNPPDLSSYLTRADALNTFIENVQLGVSVQVITWNSSGIWPNIPGCVITNVFKDDTDKWLDGVYYAPLQVKRNGNWYTVTGGNAS